MGFKKDFVWGAAAASFQIEGGSNEGGRGQSVWDMFCEIPGNVKDGDDGKTACGHYHKYREDAALMKEMGLSAYRLSISWTRIMADGTGAVNEEGLAYYDNLINELIANGITPYVTLFHWDYPYALYKKGGWINPGSPDWFADYTKIVVERYSDRVKYWMTLNEPQCFVGLGHMEGRHAPGLKLGIKEVLAAGHNALLAHGKAVMAIRKYAKIEPVVGFAPVGICAFPDSNSEADINAAREETFAINKKNCWNSSWWMEPVYNGKYPEDGIKLFGELMPEIKEGDMEIISQPLDFCGMNIYHGTRVRRGEDGRPEIVKKAAGAPVTAIKWPVTPEALYWGPKFFYERYGKPVLITENGLSNTDWVSLDGKVHDPQRIDYLWRYLKEYRRAADDGVDLMGYFCWSVMDNFEWAEGYDERFGLIYVDYATGKRTIKDSGYWYRGVIESNGENL